MIDTIVHYVQNLLAGKMCVTIDHEDGSITLNKNLYERMQKDCKQRLDEVYCFAADKTFGWMCNPHDIPYLKSLEEDDKEYMLPVAKVQYNTKEKCIGFMPTNPTVAQIAYDYDLPIDKKVMLTVKRLRTFGETWYRIEKPKNI